MRKENIQNMSGVLFSGIYFTITLSFLVLRAGGEGGVELIVGGRHFIVWGGHNSLGGRRHLRFCIDWGIVNKRGRIEMFSL